MKKEKFEPIADYPPYVDDPVEHVRALRHNLSNLTKEQLIEFAVGVAIEAGITEVDNQEAK